jgi:hypothetical protein
MSTMVAGVASCSPSLHIVSELNLKDDDLIMTSTTASVLRSYVSAACIQGFARTMNARAYRRHAKKCT